MHRYCDFDRIEDKETSWRRTPAWVPFCNLSVRRLWLPINGLSFLLDFNKVFLCWFELNNVGRQAFHSIHTPFPEEMPAEQDFQLLPLWVREHVLSKNSKRIVFSSRSIALIWGITRSRWSSRASLALDGPVYIVNGKSGITRRPSEA